MLGSILATELGKTGKFEVVAINPESLRSLTSRANWTGTEILPPDFFDSLQRVYGCDAVLFGELTLYHAYYPLAVGWRLKLVDVRTRQILWAVDEDFDTSQKAVSQEAHSYQSHTAKWPAWLDWSDTREEWLLDNSPRQFGQYTAARVVATLPGRQEKTKVSPAVADVPSGRRLDKTSVAPQ